MGAGHAPGQAVTGATVAFTVLAGLATIMRLFTRLHIVHTAGIDDVSIIIAMVGRMLCGTAMNDQ